MILIGSLGALALIIAAVGTYGVLAYAVTTRTREIGIRIALGANAWTVGGLVVRQGVVYAALGIVIGLGAAVATARAFQSLLYGVGAMDPLTLSVVPVVLLGVTIGCAPSRLRAPCTSIRMWRCGQSKRAKSASEHGDNDTHLAVRRKFVRRLVGATHASPLGRGTARVAPVVV